MRAIDSRVVDYFSSRLCDNFRREMAYKDAAECTINFGDIQKARELYDKAKFVHN